MEKITLYISNKKQEEVLTDLFGILKIDYKKENQKDDFEPAEGNKEQFKKALQDVKGMWKDKKQSFDEFRNEAWGGRGI